MSYNLRSKSNPKSETKFYQQGRGNDNPIHWKQCGLMTGLQSIYTVDMTQFTQDELDALPYCKICLEIAHPRK